MVISSNYFLPLFLLTLNHALFLTCYSHNNHTRQDLEIIIGIGGGRGSGSNPPSPPPNSPGCPPPPRPKPQVTPPPKLPPKPQVKPKPQPQVLPFVSKRIERAYYVIQKFKSRIKRDPKHIKDTWEGHDVCNKYKGFFCDTLLSVNEVALAGVNFNGYNFDGPDLHIDGFIDELPDIIVFHANSNNFKGNIPTNIVKVQSLLELDLSNNKYSCPFPYEILTATNLTFLDLRFNSFSGLVPPQVFNLDVDVLFINNNGFYQNIPGNLGSTPALYVTLANNLFSGPIPVSIGRAGKTLLEILLLNNSLSGCLPCEIGHLEKATLFDASQNFLTGPIPLSFACLGKMEILNLARNELYGAVPEMVCKLPNLSNFTLSENYFTKVGPECLKLIEKRVLHVEKNCIPGLPWQRSKEECWAFFRRAKRCADGRWFHWTPCGLKGLPRQRRNLLELTDYSGPRAYATLNPQLL